MKTLKQLLKTMRMDKFIIREEAQDKTWEDVRNEWWDINEPIGLIEYIEENYESPKKKIK